MRARVSNKQDLIRIAIRLPVKLHRDLESVARANDRSINYEIVTRLIASIKLDEILDAKTTSEAMEMLDALRRRLRDLRLADGETD